jgi:rubredoxin-NAD+ reductase
MHAADLLIVGAGLAGYTLAREVRKRDPTLDILLISADAAALYSKPVLSNALAQRLDPAGLVQADAEAQAAKLGIRVLPYCQVRGIDRQAHRVETTRGCIDYRRLVLAHGARPRTLTFPGARTMARINHLDAYLAFRARLRPGMHVCIQGAGLVGCEFANDLAVSGHRVTVIEQAPRPLAALLPEALSLRVRDALAGAGVAWRCGQSIAAIEAAPPGYLLHLDDGEFLRPDLTLAATGLEPDAAWVTVAGLTVERGVVVDAMLATADADVFALGDCAQAGAHFLPYVLPIMQQARALAATLTGTPTRVELPAMPVVVKTPACPLVVCPPAPEAVGEWLREQDDAAGAVYQFVGEAGRLLGFALAGDRCNQRRQFAARVPPLAI